MIFHRTEKGFTLVELMIVVAVIALLAGLTIPNIVRARLNSNENHAISNLQTISASAQTYWSLKNALPTTLGDLSDEKLLDTTLGCATASCTKSGYVYAVEGTGVDTDFFIRAVPENATSGIRSFCADSDGATRVNTAGATPADRAACIAWTAL